MTSSEKHSDKTRILLVEDDLELAELISERLEREGYAAIHVVSGEAACERILSDPPHLVILDIMLPGLDGFEVCRKVRPRYKGPILILTARDEDMDQVLGLELGADDYVVKPIRPRVLLARIRALLRRPSHQGDDRSVTLGSLTVNARRREAFIDGRPVPLTTAEFDLLWHLVQHAGVVLSRNEIYLALYNTEYDGLDRSVDVYVSRLRQKLGDDPLAPRYLKTVRGRGYLFAGEDA